MLDTASRELESLRDENEDLRDQLARIFSAAESVTYSAPEAKDNAYHRLFCAVQQVKRSHE